MMMLTTTINLCEAENCVVETRAPKEFCPKHWRMIPEGIRSQIYWSVKRGQNGAVIDPLLAEARAAITEQKKLKEEFTTKVKKDLGLL